jgi:hypothetical protein
MHRQPAWRRHHKRWLLTRWAGLQLTVPRRVWAGAQGLVGQRLAQDLQDGGFLDPHLLQEVWMLFHKRGGSDTELTFACELQPQASLGQLVTDRQGGASVCSHTLISFLLQ